MSKIKMVTLINRKDDQKDLGEWTVDDKRYHPILGAACDRDACAKAKAEGKAGPYPPEIEIPKVVLDHIKKESPAMVHWLNEDAPGGSEIHVKAA